MLTLACYHMHRAAPQSSGRVLEGGIPHSKKHRGPCRNIAYRAHSGGCVLPRVPDTAQRCAGFTACTPVGTGATVPLYQRVTSFMPELSPDFSNLRVFPFELDPFIVASTLGSDGTPVYADAPGHTRTTTGKLVCLTA